MNSNPVFFPYGTQYHRAPTPLPDEWEHDMGELKSAGFTHIQFRPQWRWHEAQRGEFVFDDLDRLFDLAQEHQLRVVLKPMLETAPDWVFSDLDGTRIGFHGVPISPIAHGAYYIGGWWPCFDNPKVMRAALGFVQELVLRYREHPALWIYNAWNEPRSRPMGSCQCCHSQNAYRKWLQERFGTIEDLNDFYGKRWTSFDSLAAPCSTGDYVEMALWRDWAASAVAGYVKGVIDEIKSFDLIRPVMFHRGGVDLQTDIAWDAGSDILNAQTGCDWYGLSCAIEFHPQNPQDHGMIAMQCDWIRRVDCNFWVHEFYPRLANWERSPHINHLEQQSLMSIASGGRGFTWWQYRSERVGNETNGFGLVEIDGSPTERSAYAKALGEFLKKYGPQLAPTSPPRGQAAILYCRQTDMISRLAVTKETLGGPPPQPVYFTPYKKSVIGAHALYWLHNIERDFVVPGDDLSGYKALHVSGVEMLSFETSIWLRQYVEKGGFLIVEFPFACRDENSWVSRQRPNHKLEELLGCRETVRVQIDGRADDRVIWPGVGEVNGHGCRCDFHVTTGESLAYWADGKPAVIRHRYGTGTVISLGINLSESHERGTVSDAMDFFREMIAMSDVHPLLPLSLAAKVAAHRRSDEQQEILFLFNITEESQIVAFPKGYEAWQQGALDQKNELIIPPRQTWIGGRSIKTAIDGNQDRSGKCFYLAPTSEDPAQPSPGQSENRLRNGEDGGN